MSERSEVLWSRLETSWLEVPVGTGAPSRAKSTWEELPGRLDRCFRQVSAYVGQRVDDRDTLRRIVTEVLAESWGIFIAPCDEGEELKRLKASADRLIAQVVGTSPDVCTPSDAREPATVTTR